jgi:hypothetical protein
VEEKPRISQELAKAIKCAGRPQYRISLEADLRADQLGRLLRGVDRVWPQDERVLRVARILNVPDERAFASE